VPGHAAAGPSSGSELEGLLIRHLLALHLLPPSSHHLGPSLLHHLKGILLAEPIINFGGAHGGGYAVLGMALLPLHPSKGTPQRWQGSTPGCPLGTSAIGLAAVSGSSAPAVVVVGVAGSSLGGLPSHAHQAHHAQGCLRSLF
jgi:hypothetical protein